MIATTLQFEFTHCTVLSDWKQSETRFVTIKLILHQIKKLCILIYNYNLNCRYNFTNLI